MNVRAFKYDDQGKMVVSSVGSPITASTRPLATDVRLVRPGRRKCRIIWEPIDEVDGYAIYMARGRNNTDFEHIATVNGSDNFSYTVSNLVTGQVNYFKVKTFNKTTDGYAVSKASSTRFMIGI